VAPNPISPSPWGPPRHAAPADTGAVRTRRRTPLVLAVAGVVAVVAAAAVGVWLGTRSSAPSSTPAQARRLVQSSLAAAQAAGSFHYVSTSTSSSPTTSSVKQVTIGDAGASSGRQAITISGDTFDVVVVGTTAYLRGDASAMVASLGIPAAVAEAHAGQWISLVPGDAPYQSVEVAVTTASALDQNVTFNAGRESGTVKVDGQTTTAVQGSMSAVDGQPAHGTATLYVRTGPHPLPVRYVERGTVGKGSSASQLNFAITFSSWGEDTGVTAPTGATPFSSLGVTGGTPTGPGPTIIT
jgi:hypothetical protein